MIKKMNHADYMGKTRSLSIDSLRFIMRDCKAAMIAMPNGINDGYYADEINYCAMELHRRALSTSEV
jgi:hypothetical protein